MTIAEMKRRLQPGAQVRQIWHAYPAQGVEGHDRIFTVTGTQNNAVYGTVPGVERRVWLYFPKRDEVVFTAKGWTRLDKGQELAKYEWVDAQEVSA